MYYILKSFSFVLSKLPTTFISKFAVFLSFFFYDVLRARRGVVEKNLKIAFKDKSQDERNRIGRKSYESFILTFFEFMRGFYHDLGEGVTIEGKEYAHEVLEQGKGSYVLCFHIGNWEAMGSAITKQIVPSYVLVKKVGSDSVDRFVSEIREKNGFLTIKRKKKGEGYLKIVKALDANRMVGFVMDQARTNSPRLPFFGELAKTNTSFAAIWLKRPAPIMVSFAIRTGFNQHTVFFKEPIKIDLSGNDEQDILDMSTKFNLIIESVVSKYPEYYFWIHNRWK